MTERIIHLEVEGRRRLGFDTGLSPQAFAQAKLAQFIIQEGAVVLPGGKAEPWRAGGVVERRGTMVVWGPDFEGERLDHLLKPGALRAPGGRDRALEALGCWIAARPQGEDLWPAGVFVSLDSARGEAGSYPAGTLFFPPERLRLRAVQAEGEEAWLMGGESLVCRDLGGEAATVFTAGAMLYRVLAAGDDSAAPSPEGALPFPARDQDLLHQDMREGVFLPLRLAAPGLDPAAADMADRAIAGLKAPGPRPSLEDLAGLLKPGASLFREPGEGELEKLREERRRFEKKRDLTVGTRRFVVRNTAILGGLAAALVIVIIIINSIAASRRDRPTTGGMDSRQVVETYYDAFGTLDHTLMEACVLKKAGKGDIDLVTRYFVTTKVRQAYEYTAAAVIAAKDWFEMGAPPTGTPVFGVTDLVITRLAGDESGGELSYRAAYILWMPGPADEEDEEGRAPIRAVPGPARPEDPPEAGFPPGMGTPAPADFIPPQGYSFSDELTLVLHKGNWRISRIDREYL
jgi:hypothetical protein